MTDETSPTDPGSTGLPPDVEAALFSGLFEATPTAARELVDSLCRQHPRLEATVRRVAADVAGIDDLLGPALTAAEPHPETIGAFRIEGVLGSGGMGVVYRARQFDPDREVAIKVVKLGMDTEAVLRRFDAERQTLARMAHDHIAKVFSSGVTERGQPFVVMELVDGEPLTDFCDAHALDLEERIRLLVQVCAGVQHAHHQGVIHRDLKPSNVLVTRQEGGRAAPKIIDFGLARAIVPDGEEQQSLLTQQGVIVGTPEYMSPEQAGLDGHPVDTRTDVYALGVVLYELLTGQLPLASDDLRRAPLTEMQRMICEHEPPRPSTRASSLGHDAATIAQRRGLGEVTTLRRALRGDLDWICMRALDKDPDRRYRSPADLADDLERFLRHEPVDAGPPTTVYRVRKWVRRHRAAVVAASLVGIALLVGGIGTIVGFVQAESNLRNFNRLAAGVRLEAAQDAERPLYPAWPSRIDAMERWLAEHAGPLRDRLPDLIETRDVLRARALPLTAEEAARDRETDPVAAQIAEAHAQIAACRDQIAGREQWGATFRADLDDAITRYEREIRKLEPRLGERRTWRFADDADLFLHDAIAQLVEVITSFVDDERGVTAGVEQRLRWARDIHERSIASHRTTWDETIAAVAADARFDGFTLTPQTGLVPIGPDPDSGLQEFHHLHSAVVGTSLERDPRTGRFEQTPDTGIVFVLVPGGTFLMGAQKADPNAPCYDPDCHPFESPPIEVTVGPFLIGKFELTQSQFYRLTDGENPSQWFAGRTVVDYEIDQTNPVESVSWLLCEQVLSPYGLTFPTEAQWAFACRGGVDEQPRGPALEGLANIADAKAAATTKNWSGYEAIEDGFTMHAPVGSFGANGYGLHDMYGNVKEWCRDWMDGYDIDAPFRAGDGERVIRETGHRVARGGAFRWGYWDQRPTRRLGLPPDTASQDIGVRASRALLDTSH